MDKARRSELAARRIASAARARQRSYAADRAAFVRMVPILAALEAADAPYDSHYYRVLPPAQNAWAHDPQRWPMRVDHTTPLPAEEAARPAAINAAVSNARAAAAEATARTSDAAITVILRDEALVLTLPLAVLTDHLPLILREALHSEIGLSDIAGAWFVEVTRAGVAFGTLAGD